MSKQFPLVAIFDANDDATILRDSGLLDRARMLGNALGSIGLGSVSRIGPKVISETLNQVAEAGSVAIAVSPASSQTEHERAFRLPLTSFPLIYSGRGATGADLISLASAVAVVVIGSSEELLESVLSSIGNRDIPLGVLTEEYASTVRGRVSDRHSALMANLSVSNDSNTIVRDIFNEIRKRELNGK